MDDSSLKQSFSSSLEPFFSELKEFIRQEVESQVQSLTQRDQSLKVSEAKQVATDSSENNAHKLKNLHKTILMSACMKRKRDDLASEVIPL